MKKNILLLGGSSEAFELANEMHNHPEIKLISSLAGRTSLPRKPKGSFRVGGFGGVTGLLAYLRDQNIDALVDATHPFANTISHNAAKAAEQSGLPRLRICRPAWKKTKADNWIEVSNPAAAAQCLTPDQSPVFLTIGRLELAAFLTRTELTFLTRAIEPPKTTDPAGRSEEAWPENFSFIYGKGPFDFNEELNLIRSHGIRAIVSKNSGSTVAFAKIEVARKLNLPVIMINRPKPPSGITVSSVPEAIAWLEQL